MPVLVDMLTAGVSELVLCLHVGGTDYAFLSQLLYKKVPHSHVLYLRAVDPVAGDVHIRVDVDVH